MTPRLLSTSTLITITAAITLCYTLACWIWPFRTCRRCAGTGRRRSPTGRAFPYCRRCRATGARLRAGRWLHNRLTRIRRDAR